VQEVDVEVIAPKAFRAVAARLQNLFASEATPSASHSRTRRDFRRDKKVIADSIKRLSEDSFVPRFEVSRACNVAVMNSAPQRQCSGMSPE
jgi:hypothetical protein